jgi:hypothetical protein
LGNTVYHPEGETGPFYPFTLRRSYTDPYGLQVTIPINYTGSATAPDFTYRQTSVTMGTEVGVEIRVFDDTVLEPTETIVANIYSGYDSNGVYHFVGYPQGIQPPTDPDGLPATATAYIVDGDIELKDASGAAIGESQEESPGGVLDVGLLRPRKQRRTETKAQLQMREVSCIPTMHRGMSTVETLTCQCLRNCASISTRANLCG